MTPHARVLQPGLIEDWSRPGEHTYHALIPVLDQSGQKPPKSRRRGDDGNAENDDGALEKCERYDGELDAEDADAYTEPEPCDEEPESDEEYEGCEEGDPAAADANPDVHLDVPVLKVDGIDLDVEDLRARVSLQAEVLDLLKLNVGADVRPGRVHLGISGVEAQAQLKVRLDNVARIIDRVLTTLDRNPEILHELARGAGSAVQDVGGGAREAIGELGTGAGRAVQDVGRGAGAAVQDVGHGAGRAVEDVGGDVGQAGSSPTRRTRRHRRLPPRDPAHRTAGGRPRRRRRHGRVTTVATSGAAAAAKFSGGVTPAASSAGRSRSGRAPAGWTPARRNSIAFISSTAARSRTTHDQPTHHSPHGRDNLEVR
ncbi:hypothetical protein [Streptomyces sp. NPDC006527]|uniref:hypothetical protein n=1 Tax=Streptomyces sp. NPDC006527 TaxID=3364749 RepID=UPI00367A37EF